MIDKEIIKKAAKYYIENNVTLQDAASYVGIKSKKTLNKYFESLGQSALKEDMKLYKEILNKKKTNETLGRKKGSQMGKRSVSYTKKDVKTLYEFVVSNNATYRESEAVLGIPRSTAYEMLHSDFLSDDEKLEIARIAKENTTNPTYKDCESEDFYLNNNGGKK